MKFQIKSVPDSTIRYQHFANTRNDLSSIYTLMISHIKEAEKKNKKSWLTSLIPFYHPRSNKENAQLLFEIMTKAHDHTRTLTTQIEHSIQHLLELQKAIITALHTTSTQQANIISTLVNDMFYRAERHIFPFKPEGNFGTNFILLHKKYMNLSHEKKKEEAIKLLTNYYLPTCKSTMLWLLQVYNALIDQHNHFLEKYLTFKVPESISLIIPKTTKIPQTRSYDSQQIYNYLTLITKGKAFVHTLSPTHVKKYSKQYAYYLSTTNAKVA